jgi:lipopolysaccharide heptosyltransferase I
MVSEKQPNKILLVRFSALGDVIQTLPILTMLREAFPQAKIGWAIDEELVSAIEGHPALDYVHACSRKSWSKQLKNPAQWAQTMRDMKAFADDVRAVGYDVAIDAQGLFKTALLPYFAGIKRRIGYKHGRELSSVFYTEKYLTLREYFDPSVFHLEHMALLAKAAGAADVRYGVEPPVVQPALKEKVARLFDNAFREQAPVVAMAFATQWESKHWPHEHWVALIDQLLSKTNLNLLMVGSKGDAPLVEKIIGTFPSARLNGRVLNVAGKTSVREMYALYEHAQAAVGSDSAPLHIAGAVRVPVVIGIYGPTGYRRTPPIGSEHIRLFSTEGKLPCQPCHKRTCPLGTDECMTSIRPDEIFEGLIAALAEAGIYRNSNVPICS